MFVSREAKELATTLGRHSHGLLEEVLSAFEESVVQCRSEVVFFRSLIQNLQRRLNSLSIPGASFQCRQKEIHQKPIVSGSFGNCELGDLLIVVKYHLVDFTTETKSIIYQAKMCDRGSRVCSIDQTQLELLRDWPPFEFGRKRDGGRQLYSIQPQTLEFGSYMLEPREARPGEFLSYFWHPHWAYPYPTYWHRFYGVCPTAMESHYEGPSRVDISNSMHFAPDAWALVDQILFGRGEHHSNSPVSRLVSALYRYIGLEPDPPGEFEGFWKEPEEDGFSILEINVRQGEREGNA
jgi:hypothetical protein